MVEQSQQILYVDDDRSLRDEISLFLPGYRISCCETIGEGLTLATHQTFALYLLNLSLPDGSGIGLCQKIRAFDLNTPIVVISIHESESYRKYARQVGAHGFWEKSGDLHYLKTIIEECLRDSRLRSFEAKRAEFAAIRDELAQQREEARARQAQAREVQDQYREKSVMLAASRAFENAGGSRADFSDLWPEAYAEASAE
jgi:DNA-binding response OmpR family regulator